MSNEFVQKFVKEYPQARCLWCSNFSLDTHSCKIGATIPCGRAFNPKRGGELVPV